VEGGKRRTWIATLERHGEPSIRRIFSESYRDLADSHTSIRKMVRSALTSDLALSLPTAKSSCIHSYYKARGGFFLVALCPGNDDDTSDHPQKVLGGIGVRRMGFDELKSRAFPYDTSVTFEIHRLVVDYSCRRHGIGSMLLGRAKELIHSSLLCYVDSSFQLVATSPALIESANAFYVANDFSLMTSVKVGKMRMNTYIARCS
jgi:ribosomal protein S18 acetylase RimI-like enzyme